MLNLWWTLVIAAIVTVSVSGQFKDLGKNYGVNIRLNQRGLSYAVQKATNELYHKYRNEQVPDIINNRARSFRYWITRMNVLDLSMPKVDLQINPGQGVSAAMGLQHIKITGKCEFQQRFWFFWAGRSGRFTATAGQITMDTALGVGMERTGRPTVAKRSCKSSFGSFYVDIDIAGIIGWIIDMFEGTINNKIKSIVYPMICEQVEEMITGKVNQALKEMDVSTELQDIKLKLDYALVRPPIFQSNLIDTTVKGDVSWKGQKTGIEPSPNRNWTSVPGDTRNMVTIYITDYLINALGALLHNDGALSYNVTRNEFSDTLKNKLRLTCPDEEMCAGTLFPDLAERYPDGWVEAGLRTNRPPRLDIKRDLLTGNFSGIFELYIKEPNGQKTRVAVAEAQMTIPLFLNVTKNMLTAHVSNPSISIISSQAHTAELEEILNQLSEGFTQHELEGIGQKGFKLPSYKNITMVNPQIHLLDGVIAISTDVDYTGI